MPDRNDFEFIQGCAVHKSIDVYGVSLPQDVIATPGMISLMERSMLYAFTRNEYRSDGVVIDGGSFFGSSIVSSASGLLDNPGLEAMDFSKFPDNKPIHGYELGFLPAPKNRKADPRRVFNGVEYIMGESFIPILEKSVEPFKALVSMNIGDLNDFPWDGTPIEICFIDVCKTGKLNRHVSKEFYPSLIPGASTLINQDFFFDRLPWIKVTMGYLEEYFEWQGQVYTSSIYRNIKQVPREVAAYDPYTSGTLEECLALHDKSPMQFLEPKYKYYLELSKAYLMALKHAKEDALAYLEMLEKDYADLLDDEDTDRGNQFRMNRARKQITNGNIHKVS